MRTRWSAALAVAVTSLALTTAASAHTGGTQVAVENYMFMDMASSATLGGSVTWTFDDSVQHTSTGAGFWDSGPKSKGQTYRHTFASSGTYAYICTIHAYMAGTIAVPLTAPGSAAAGYTVTWAVGKGTPGASYDVQVRKPGSKAWTKLESGTKAHSVRFDPAKAGSYAVRARTDKGGTDTGWSPVRSLKIT